MLDAYDIYQHLMDFWTEAMQDDAYLISADGWVKGAQPREIVRVKGKNNKLSLARASGDYLKGGRRFKSDLVPAATLVARHFRCRALRPRDARYERRAALEQQLEEMREGDTAARMGCWPR